MRQIPLRADDDVVEDEQGQENRLTLSLAAVAVLLCLVVAGLFLIQRLQSKGRIEDCLLMNRLNCDQLVEAQN